MGEETWFSRLYDTALAPCEWLGLRRIRQELVGDAAGWVLEVGAGTGLNLPHYRRARRVMATDPDPAMLRQALPKLRRAVVPVTLVVADAQALPFRDGAFDTVVATCVFCTIPDPEAAFRELRRVLRPAGEVRLLEHVRAASPAVARLQDRLTPAWSRIAGGCQLNRDPLRSACRAGFTVEALRGALGGVILRARLRRPSSRPSQNSAKAHRRPRWAWLDALDTLIRRCVGSGTMPLSKRSGGASHWDQVYRGKAEAELSWHQEEPDLSLRLIQRFAPARVARIIDVGAGTSPLAGRLVDRGYQSVTVLDVSEAALAALRQRLGDRAEAVRFLVGDLLQLERLGPFDCWHDRAVFHFLTAAEDRARYAALAASSLAPGGHILVATFAPDGPECCSGLPVCRYDAEGIARALGPAFTLLAAEREIHKTPWGMSQPFTYAVLRRAVGL